MVDRMEPRHKFTVKIGDQLRTIQGYTLEEYVEARNELIAEMSGDAEVVALARAAGTAATLVAGNTVAPAAPMTQAPPSAAWPAAPAPAPAVANATAPQCAHGPRTGRSGTGAKGPWKAWFCPTPKGTPDQCEAIFLNRNSPDWNSFPA